MSDTVREIIGKNFEEGKIDTLTFLKANVQYTEIIEKAEGSRGGKVIGHTKSGKAIYDTHNHPGHKDFTSEDHREAMNAHRQSMENHYKERVDFSGKNTKEEKEKHYDEHTAAARAHTSHYWKHEDASIKKHLEEREKSTIGKTTSGKNIYEHHSADHKHYNDFTKKDHMEAAAAHHAHAEKRGEREGYGAADET